MLLNLFVTFMVKQQTKWFYISYFIIMYNICIVGLHTCTLIMFIN